ncbi:TIGR01459 family HAD-type hydrolase [Oryzibacter oryziterrae]|uniref:TIGR01459 family HAD-type hydrolase n=1 Tax=Oryzibacter oryziterrae TaxID=2766474 RepID=UPI001F491672|nr:TIGR01459 family HAD-type hydrolase [Oryzibacter oryziterrae]
MQNVNLIPGLSAIAANYDGIICDVWGVLHNGVIGYEAAAVALARFKAEGKAVVLLTNAPRPAADVATIIKRFGIEAESYDAIVTSGDVCRTLLSREPKKKAFHLGPSRDLGLFEGLDLTLVDEEEAEYVVVTGLFDDDTETAEDYRSMLTRFAFRGLTLYCANPDVVVERGHRLVYCAGALAQLYDELGGKVVTVGKPYKPVYDAALETLATVAGGAVPIRRVLAIGDALPTDVKGAWGQGIDVLMVTAGIHAADFGDPDRPDLGLLAKRLAVEGLTIQAAIPRLAW